MRTLIRLLGLLKPHRRAIIVSLVLAWAAMGMTVLIPYLIGETINAIQAGDEAGLLPLALAVVGAGVLRLALVVARRLVAGRVSLDIEYRLRQRFYAHLQSLDLSFFDTHQTGQLMSRGTVDLQSIRFFLGYGLIFLSQNFLTILLASAVMLWLNPVLALLALAPLPLIAITANRYSRRSAPAFKEAQQRLAELTAEAEESVSGVRVIKAFSRERHMLGRFEQSVERLFDQNIYANRLSALYNPIIGAIPNLGVAIVLVVGGSQVIAGSLQLGELTAFYIYLLMLTGPMRMLGVSLNMAQRAVASGQRMFEIIDRPTLIESPPNAVPLAPGPGAVSFRDVSLDYGNGQLALTEVNLDIEAGKAIALVGPTGSGKSSLTLLISRLYDPTTGQVLIDGQDVATVELDSLRRQIASTGSEPFLFSATVFDNIAYARPQASPEEVELAAKRAQAHDFIEALPAGYDTMLGERGLTLSGGQRQRIAIARALILDPRILILDDATSSIDARTEAAVHSGLREALQGRTTFIVAHRMSSIVLADEVVVIDAGRILDRGTHAELRERSKIYREITEHGLEDDRRLPGSDRTDELELIGL